MPAIKTLSAIGPNASEAVPQLALKLDRRDKLIRDAAALALARIGPSSGSAVPRLVAILEADPDDRAAIMALRGYPVIFSCDSRYLNGTGFIELSGFNRLSMR
jgi:hypothetical protein